MRKLLTFICTLLVAIGASATINRNLHASVVLEKKTTTENELNLSTVGIRQAIIGEVEMTDEVTMEEWNAEYVAKRKKAAAADYDAHDYYFTEGMMHFGYTPQFYGLWKSFIAVPYLDSVVWTNYYGPTNWYMQHNDELVAENSETYVTGYGINGSYYLPYTTDHTLTQNGQTYNIKGYKYAAGNENGGYLASAASPIINSTGEMIPLTLCGMKTDPMNNESGSDFYKIGANSLDCPYAYGTNLYADVEHTLRVDTIISTVRNLSPLKINAINIPIYNLNGTTMIPKNGEIKIEIFAADLTMGMIYTDSILATAVATIDNFQEFQTGMGTIVATFQEEDPFGGMMDVSIVVEGDFVVQLTGYNESGCDFGIFADYYTPGGTTMYKVGGKYTPIFSKSSNLAISYDAYWPVAIASLSQEALVAPVEGGVAMDSEYSAFAIFTNVYNLDTWIIDKETSDWLGVSLDDSNLETDGYLIGQITSEALPVGMTGRKGVVVIDADGYKLSIPVIQEKNTYTLTVKSNNSSMGTVSGSGVYVEGENVQISATPHYGYHFSHWNDYNYDNPRQVQVTEDKIYTAYFYKNTYTIFVDYNSTYGTVTGPTSGEYQDEITLTATPNIGYEFVEWSDGVKDNSRTIVLNEDIYLSAYFAQAYSGQCGDNLYWKYDSESQTIAITGSGEMYHYTSSTQPWILFKEQIRKVEISNDATSLGTSAFEGCRSLGEIHIGLNLLDIYENVFAGCRRLYHIYSYPTYPPFADITSFANYSADVHIPCESYEWYVRDDVWGQFNIKCLGAEAEDVPTGEVTTTTTNTSVTITWPTDEDADTYTIEIKKGDQIFCTLTFSKDGQLTNIAFAPSRDGQHRAQYAEATTKGLRFTVTSLDSGTRYGYDITTKNENEEVIDSYSGEFTTKSDVATDIDNVTATDNTVQKLLRDNQLLILRNGNTYNVMGAEVE